MTRQFVRNKNITRVDEENIARWTFSFKAPGFYCFLPFWCGAAGGGSCLGHRHAGLKRLYLIACPQLKVGLRYSIVHLNTQTGRKLREQISTPNRARALWHASHVSNKLSYRGRRFTQLLSAGHIISNFPLWCHSSSSSATRTLKTVVIFW